MRLFCIGHKPPGFRLDHDFSFVTPNPVPGLHNLHVPDDRYGPAFDGMVLAEYTQLRALADMLAAEGSDDEIYIFQYRRFLGLQRPPRRSTNLPFAYATRAIEAAGLFPGKAERASLAGARLVCPLGGIASMAAQYAMFHHAEDFTCFAMALAEVEGFDRKRRQTFASIDQHFPAPSLGTMRASHLIDTMRVLVSAWDAFHAHYYEPREGKQRRVGGFLLERLQSFLLFEELERGKELLEGFLNIVSETDVIEATV
jgi:hypothetical protein